MSKIIATLVFLSAFFFSASFAAVAKSGHKISFLSFNVCQSKSGDCQKKYSAKLTLSRSDVNCVEPVTIANYSDPTASCDSRSYNSPTTNFSSQLTINLTPQGTQKLKQFMSTHLGSATEFSVLGMPLAKSVLQTPIGSAYQVVGLSNVGVSKVLAHRPDMLCRPYQAMTVHGRSFSFLRAMLELRHFFIQPSYRRFVLITGYLAQIPDANPILPAFTVMVLNQHPDYFKQIKNDYPGYNHNFQFVVANALKQLGKLNVIPKQQYTSMFYARQSLTPTQLKDLSINDNMSFKQFLTNMDHIRGAYCATGNKLFFDKFTNYYNSHRHLASVIKYCDNIAGYPGKDNTTNLYLCITQHIKTSFLKILRVRSVVNTLCQMSQLRKPTH